MLLNSIGFGGVDVLRVLSSSPLLIGSLTRLDQLCRSVGRGFNRSGGGERLQTYKKVLENSVAAAEQRCLARCCVNMPTSLGHASVGLRDPEKLNFHVFCAQRHCWPLLAHRRSDSAPDARFT